MTIHHPIAPAPTGTLAAEIVATIRERARHIEPYHPARSRWVALKAAADLTPEPGKSIILNVLAYEMSTQMNADDLDDLAASMRMSAEVWAEECERGAGHLRDRMNRLAAE